MIQRACPTFLDSVRLDSKSWQERTSEIRSKLRFVSDQFVQSASHVVLELTGRTGGCRSIAGRPRNSNQRVSRFSRRLPLIFATDSILALQTRNSVRMVDLPPEIICNIVSLSVPPPRFENRDRANFLLPLCHLHSSLRRFVQHQLFKHPVLVGTEAIGLFVRTVETGDDFGGWVFSLRFGKPSGVAFVGAAHMLHRIIVSCNAVEELWLQHVPEIQWSTLVCAKRTSFLSSSASVVDKAADLRSLLCWGGSLIVNSTQPSEETSSLQKLENLSLGGISIITVPSLAQLFTPALLPSLCRLSVYLVYIDDVECSPAQHLSPVASQLRHLSLNPAVDGHSVLLAKCVNLVAFDCTIARDFLQSIPNPAPHPVRYFRFGFADQAAGVAASPAICRRAFEWGLVGTGSKVFLRETELVFVHGVMRVWFQSRGMQAEFLEGAASSSWDEEREDFAQSFWAFSRWVDAQEKGSIVA